METRFSKSESKQKFTRQDSFKSDESKEKRNSDGRQTRTTVVDDFSASSLKSELKNLDQKSSRTYPKTPLREL